MRCVSASGVSREIGGGDAALLYEARTGGLRRQWGNAVRCKPSCRSANGIGSGEVVGGRVWCHFPLDIGGFPSHALVVRVYDAVMGFRWLPVADLHTGRSAVPRFPVAGGFPWRRRSLIGFWELGGKCACGGEVGAEVGDGERGMLKYGSDDLASPHAGRLRHISASHVLSHTG
jgi:hypothetical protein